MNVAKRKTSETVLSLLNELAMSSSNRFIRHGQESHPRSDSEIEVDFESDNNTKVYKEIHDESRSTKNRPSFFKKSFTNSAVLNITDTKSNGKKSKYTAEPIYNLQSNRKSSVFHNKDNHSSIEIPIELCYDNAQIRERHTSGKNITENTNISSILKNNSNFDNNGESYYDIDAINKDISEIQKENFEENKKQKSTYEYGVRKENDQFKLKYRHNSGSLRETNKVNFIKSKNDADSDFNGERGSFISKKDKNYNDKLKDSLKLNSDININHESLCESIRSKASYRIERDNSRDSSRHNSGTFGEFEFERERRRSGDSRRSHSRHSSVSRRDRSGDSVRSHSRHSSISRRDRSGDSVRSNNRYEGKFKKNVSRDSTRSRSRDNTRFERSRSRNSSQSQSNERTRTYRERSRSRHSSGNNRERRKSLTRSQSRNSTSRQRTKSGESQRSMKLSKSKKDELLYTTDFSEFKLPRNYLKQPPMPPKSPTFSFRSTVDLLPSSRNSHGLRQLVSN